MVPQATHQQYVDGLKAHGVAPDQAKALAASGLGIGTIISLITTYGPKIIPLLTKFGPQILSIIQGLQGGGMSVTDILSMLQEILKSAGGGTVPQAP